MNKKITMNKGAAVKTGTCGDNLTWTLYDNGTLVISGEGPMKNYGLSPAAPWYSKRNNITSVIIGNGVTSIGDHAFEFCESLVSVAIGKNVKTIGDSAFSECTSLTSITIPDSVTSIGEDAFYKCYKLQSVTIGNGVTSIGEEAFWYCNSLTSIEVSEDNEYYASEDGVLFNKDKTVLIRYPAGKSGAYIIPSSVKTIGYAAFSGCNNLKSVIISNGVTTIDSFAFVGCPSLTSVTIGNGVTSIGDDAFSDCSSLTSVTIGKGVTNIGKYAFYGCSGLTDVYYGGTKEDWDKISIDSGNIYFTEAEKHYVERTKITASSDLPYYLL